MQVQPAGFPVAIKCATASVGGAHTDLVSSEYEDAVVLIATQLGTVGTVVQAKQDATLENKTTYSTTVLLGKRDEPLLTVAARQLVEMAHSSGTTKPLLCCMALKEHTPEGIKELLAAVKQHQLL